VFHTRGETFDVRDGAAAIAVEPDSAVVTIPDAHFLFTASSPPISRAKDPTSS